jgi:uncharacterized membrane protein
MASFISKDEREHLRKAIVDAEAMTSGEIRVYIEKECPGDPFPRAVHLLHKLEMHQKAHRNAVLFYLAYAHKKFAVVGDEGIHKKVEPDFWDKIKDICIESFKKNEYAAGLVNGIMLAGAKLKEQFPHQAGDVNELPDDIIEND